MLIVPMLTIPTVIEPADSIMIDGDLADWEGLGETVSGTQGSDFNSNIDIIATSAENNDDKYLSFHIDVDGQILSGEPVTSSGLMDIFHIFIDTDQVIGTGYYIGGIGAEYMLEIKGWNNEVIGSQILTFSGTDTDNWQGFSISGNTVAEINGATLETQIAWSAIGLDVPGPVAAFVHSQSWDGYHDHADYLIGHSLSIIGMTQTSAAPEIISGNDQPLLEFEAMTTETDAILQNIQVDIKGTLPLSEIDSISVEGSTGTTIFETSQISGSMSIDMGGITIAAGQSQTFTLRVDISSSATSGRTLGAVISSAEDIMVNDGVASLRTEASSNDLGYIDVVPMGVMIDGGFSDWADAEADDIAESSVSNSHSIDITRYGAQNDGSKLSFYIRTNGNIMEGASVPFAGNIRGASTIPDPVIPGPSTIDSDGDGIIDAHEPGYEYDFNNDGTPDSESDDDDGDGEIDYNAGGTDMELFNNQTKATKYIGPVDPTPPTNGYDITRIYVDSDNNSATGYSYSGLGADHLIEFTGKYGIIKSSSTMEFIGSNQGQWNWTDLGATDFEHDTRQLETMLDIQTTSDISAFFETKAWNDDGDGSDKNANAVLVTFGVRSDNGDEILGPTWPVTVYGRVTNESGDAPDGTPVTIVVKDGTGTPVAWYNTTTSTISGVQGRYVVSGITVQSGWSIEVNVSYDWSGTTYEGSASASVSSGTPFYNIDVDATSTVVIPEFDAILIPIILFMLIIFIFNRKRRQVEGKKSEI